MFIILLLALWPLVTQGDNQKDKSIIIPISIHNNVPFIAISSLCPKNSYQEIEVMLDTGSEQLWLGDKACSECSKTGAFCPHLNTITTTIKYFKGEIGGSESFLSLCGEQYKFLCVKQIDKELSLNYGHGIMGLRANSVGNKMMKKSMLGVNGFELRQIQYIFYIARDRNYLVFGSHLDFFQQQAIQEIQCTLNWTFKGQSLAFSSPALPKQVFFPLNQYHVAIDTGSSHLTLPQQICFHLQAQLLEQSGVQCILGLENIYCSKRIALSVHLKIKESHLSELTMESSVMVDEISSGIKIACLGEQNRERKILLGYPFFESYGIGFVPEQSTVRVYEYKQKQKASLKSNSSVFFLIYCSILGLCSYFVQEIISIIQQKRSVKIII